MWMTEGLNVSVKMLYLTELREVFCNGHGLYVSSNLYNTTNLILGTCNIQGESGSKRQSWWAIV